MMKVFVEQPLALPMSANNSVRISICSQNQNIQKKNNVIVQIQLKKKYFFLWQEGHCNDFLLEFIHAVGERDESGWTMESEGWIMI